MSQSFIYQPHVHETDGVLTPDLIVDSVTLLASAEATTSVSLAINLLSTETSLQDPTATGCASAALVLIAGGRGALATVASAHWNPAYAAIAPVPSEHWTPLLLCREAVRLPVVAEELKNLTLETARTNSSGSTVIGQTPVNALAGIDAAIAGYASDPPPRRSALALSPRHVDPNPSAATGYQVTLRGTADMPALSCKYTITRLQP